MKSSFPCSDDHAYRIILSLLLVFFSDVAESINVVGGRCRKPHTVQYLDVEGYLGKWYVQYSLPNYLLQPTGVSCMRAKYGLNRDGSISVYNTATQGGTGIRQEVCGRAYEPDSYGHPGSLRVEFPFLPSDSSPRRRRGRGHNYNSRHDDGNYWVLGTDYVSYAAVYACRDIMFGTSRAEVAWILTRKPKPSRETLSIAMDVLNRHNFTETDFVRVHHDPYCVYDLKPSCRNDGYPYNVFDTALSGLRNVRRMAGRLIGIYP